MPPSPDSLTACLDEIIRQCIAKKHIMTNVDGRIAAFGVVDHDGFQFLETKCPFCGARAVAELDGRVIRSASIALRMECPNALRR